MDSHGSSVEALVSQVGGMCRAVNGLGPFAASDQVHDRVGSQGERQTGRRIAWPV